MRFVEERREGYQGMAGNKCTMIEDKRTNIDLKVSFLAYESENPVNISSEIYPSAIACLFKSECSPLDRMYEASTTESPP